jgi:flavin-dependent dehydrogenase
MTIERSERVAVCIIGAGPAGSALAIRLAQLGHDVCLIERSMFPRAHIGESLSPGIWPHLDLLGAGGIVAAASFWPCRTSLVQWESDVAVRRDFGTAGGLLVDRGRFDGLLLDRARVHGVRVIQPAAVRSRTLCDQGWRLDVETAEGIRTINADFLADASGRFAFLRGRKQRTAYRTLALYGYWRGSSLPREPRIEAGSDAWYWGVPLPNGMYNAIAFVDAIDFRTRRLSSLSATYHALIGRSGLIAGCRDVRLSGPARAIDATPYLDADSIGARSIKIGDAALALDPLSSSGVQKAFNTALIGAVVVNTMLRRPDQADAASRFYTSNLAEACDRHRRWAAEHYAVPAATRPGRFWQIRATGAAAGPEPAVQSIPVGRLPPTDFRVALSPEAAFVDEPCIVGDLVALKPALRLRDLPRPVSFLGGWELARLLRPLQPGVTIGALMDAWQIPTRWKPEIVAWLLTHRVLTLHPPTQQNREGLHCERANT